MLLEIRLSIQIFCAELLKVHLERQTKPWGLSIVWD